MLIILTVSRNQQTLMYKCNEIPSSQGRDYKNNRASKGRGTAEIKCAHI